MKHIYLTPYDKLNAGSFLHVFKSTGFITPGERYRVLLPGSGELIDYYECVHVEVLRLHQLTEFHSFLDSNTDLKTFKEILALRYITEKTVCVVATFAKMSHIKALNNGK